MLRRRRQLRKLQRIARMLAELDAACEGRPVAAAPAQSRVFLGRAA